MDRTGHWAVPGLAVVNVVDLEFSLIRDERHLAVEVAGRLDAQTAPMLQGNMQEALEDINSITFDLGALEFISSAGLRILLAAYKLMNKREGSMQVVNATGDVLSVLEMSGFASLFGIA